MSRDSLDDTPDTSSPKDSIELILVYYSQRPAVARNTGPRPVAAGGCLRFEALKVICGGEQVEYLSVAVWSRHGESLLTAQIKEVARMRLRIVMIAVVVAGVAIGTFFGARYEIPARAERLQVRLPRAW